ncbi:putative ribonuclease H2 subunit B [Blattamonas nauphoetae]|uniref:Ribonuclease H2 subunit B n=1 Tax=Blattamonas nauphoetae TaxID=2049346 RepID=A0ABQ9YK83_9EUKA|nr:putative ribonuclease H2 subunit B [Blattamonas nauphoetae]
MEQSPKIVIHPNTDSGFDTNQISFTSIPHPDSNIPNKGRLYTVSNRELFQVQKFHEDYSSTLFGNFISKDGAIYIITAFDPLFILIQLLYPQLDDSTNTEIRENLQYDQFIVNAFHLYLTPGERRLVKPTLAPNLVSPPISPPSIPRAKDSSLDNVISNISIEKVRPAELVDASDDNLFDDDYSETYEIRPQKRQQSMRVDDPLKNVDAPPKPFKQEQLQFLPALHNPPSHLFHLVQSDGVRGVRRRLHRICETSLAPDGETVLFRFSLDRTMTFLQSKVDSLVSYFVANPTQLPVLSHASIASEEAPLILSLLGDLNAVVWSSDQQAEQTRKAAVVVSVNLVGQNLPSQLRKQLKESYPETKELGQVSLRTTFSHVDQFLPDSDLFLPLSQDVPEKASSTSVKSPKKKVEKKVVPKKAGPLDLFFKKK